MAEQDDAELIRESLRGILRSEGTSGKAIEAKAAAARQLAKMQGLMPDGDDKLGDDDVQAPDPFADLDVAERARQLRERRKLSNRAFREILDDLERGVPVEELDRQLDKAEGRRRYRRGVTGGGRIANDARDDPGSRLRAVE